MSFVVTGGGGSLGRHVVAARPTWPGPCRRFQPIDEAQVGLEPGRAVGKRTFADHLTG